MKKIVWTINSRTISQLPSTWIEESGLLSRGSACLSGPTSLSSSSIFVLSSPSSVVSFVIPD